MGKSINFKNINHQGNNEIPDNKINDSLKRHFLPPDDIINDAFNESIHEFAKNYDDFLNRFIEGMAMLRTFRDSLHGILSIADINDRKIVLENIIISLDQAHDELEEKLDKWLQENIK